MKPYCEIVVKEILPPLRAIIAKNLLEKHNMSQVEVAKKLGITQSAVSQYERKIRGSRAKILQRDKEILEMIENLSTLLANGEIDSIQSSLKVCEICRKIRAKGLICEMHKSIYPSLEDCRICLD